MGGLLLVGVTAILTAASLLGQNPLQEWVARFSEVVWGGIVILSYLAFRGKTNHGMLLLIQAISVLTGIGLYLKDFNEVPFGYFGGFIWSAMLLASFVFGLLYFAQFLLPLTGNEGWSEGLRLLTRHCCLDPIPARVSPGQRKANKSKVKASSGESRQRELPASFSSLRAGILNSYEVLALTKGSGFARPAGPGFVMLYRKEEIAGIVDLRKHVRMEPVEANTRDGIPIETGVTVTFRVRQSDTDPTVRDLRHPYDREAIFAVSYANSIDEQDELHAWTERLGPMAAAMLVSELSQHTLDDLFQGDEAGIATLEAIKDRLKRRLEQAANKEGVAVLDVSIDQFKLPSRVNEQRIKTWQADWKRRIQMQKASGDAQALLRIESARARTQIDIIENITQNIQAMRQSGDTKLSEIIMLRMIEALEKAMSDESVQMLIPHQVMSQLVMDSLERLQGWVEQPTGESSDF
jgi:regulator of protease activity HflC (stomatin/prohibitin superfamily)